MFLFLGSSTGGDIYVRPITDILTADAGGEVTAVIADSEVVATVDNRAVQANIDSDSITAVIDGAREAKIQC